MVSAEFGLQVLQAPASDAGGESAEGNSPSEKDAGDLFAPHYSQCSQNSNESYRESQSRVDGAASQRPLKHPEMTVRHRSQVRQGLVFYWMAHVIASVLFSSRLRKHISQIFCQPYVSRYVLSVEGYDDKPQCKETLVHLIWGAAHQVFVGVISVWQIVEPVTGVGFGRRSASRCSRLRVKPFQSLCCFRLRTVIYSRTLAPSHRRTSMR